MHNCLPRTAPGGTDPGQATCRPSRVPRCSWHHRGDLPLRESVRNRGRCRSDPLRPILLSVALIAIILPAAGSKPERREHGSRRPAVIAYVFPRDHILQPGKIEARKLTASTTPLRISRMGRLWRRMRWMHPIWPLWSHSKGRNPSLQVLISVGGGLPFLA